MKLFTDKKLNTMTRYILFIIAVTLLMILTIFKFNTILKLFSVIFKVLSPVLWGIVIAYILNPVMMAIEKLFTKIFCKKKPHNIAKRRTSVFITTVLTISLIAFLGYMIIPEIRDSIVAIPQKIKPGLSNIQDWASSLLKDHPEFKEYFNKQIDSLDSYSEKLTSSLTTTISNYFPEVSKGIINVLISLKDFVLGFIVSIYLLLSKDSLIAQFKKIMFAIFKKKTCEKATIIYRNSNKMFTGFISGKIIDSAIIGVIAYIFLMILGFKNAVLLSVIIGVTNVIPFFGPFIGAIPCGFLVLIEQPQKLLLFIIFVLILQQFDGNILGPKILGNSTGLPAFWVLFAIFLGGGLFGFAGMLLGVPTFAVIYSIFRTYIETKLQTKKLPVSTRHYKGNVDHLFTVVRAKDLQQNNDTSESDNIETDETDNKSTETKDSKKIDFEKYMSTPKKK